jgi:peptidoglycan/LPS O-acetylase OafA/YrhL
MQVDASGALSLDLALSDANTYKFMPVPQAWTLALELEFYLLAPLLVRWSIRWLVLMGLASLSLREAALYLHWFGPWVYYALPFQLVFFVTGMLSYRLSQFLRISGLKLSLIFWLVVCAEIFMGSFSRVGWLFFVSLPIALPFIFQLTKRSRLDELIGQLSYPLYVCHLFVIYLLGTASVWPVMLGSLLVSIVLLIGTRPIEQSRARLARKAAPTPAY